MLKIFICDDEKPILKHITEQVKKQILINQYDMEVKCSCESPVVLLETLRQTRDRGNIYLLDVELKHPEYDGSSSISPVFAIWHLKLFSTI